MKFSPSSVSRKTCNLLQYEIFNDQINELCSIKHITWQSIVKRNSKTALCLQAKVQAWFKH